MTLSRKFQIALCIIVWAVILTWVVIAAVMPKERLVAIVRPIVRLVFQLFWPLVS